MLAEAKLNWAFKLYDVNNDGVIDLKEMAVIIEMMDNLDGVIPGIRFILNGQFLIPSLKAHQCHVQCQ